MKSFAQFVEKTNLEPGELQPGDHVVNNNPECKHHGAAGMVKKVHKIKQGKNTVGQQEGIWEMFYESGEVGIRTPYVGGKKDGIEEGFHENGNIKARIPYKSGKEDGIEEWFYENGNTQIRTSFKDDKTDGIEEWFYENGNIRWRTPYKRDEKDGIEEWFDEQGNIVKTQLWKNGKLIEETKH